MMYILGITGPSGSGKSLACERLKELGFHHVNCDLTARVVVEKGKPCLNELASAFGKKILNDDGTLNRPELARLAFAGGKVDVLNKIIFGYIIKEINNTLMKAEQSGVKFAVLDAPTLYESGADKFCDEVLFVSAPKSDRMKRIIERDNLTFCAASARIEAQPEDCFYKSRADYTIVNDSGEKELKQKIDRLVKDIKIKEDERKNSV